MKISRFNMIIVLLVIGVTAAMCAIDPPSPGRIQELINNPYLEPENFEQFENFDYLKLLSEDISSERQKSKPRKSRKKMKYANKEEAREARLARGREYSRNWRAMVKALPEGSELKEARKKRKRDDDKKTNNIYKNLPDGSEEKEARRLKRAKYHRERIKKIKSLPDEDPRKLRYLNSQSEAQRKYAARKQAEDPKYFSKRKQRFKERQKAKQANLDGIRKQDT